MKVLIIGSGGREHAIAWKFKQSPQCDEIFIMPGNAGTHAVGTNVDMPKEGISKEGFPEIKRFIIENDIQLVVVGPENPLVDGIYDYLKSNFSTEKVAILGPGEEGAQLEGSKAYAKAFMQRHNIPTAGYKKFQAHEIEAARVYLKEIQAPYVLKADGLASGKGVIICDSIEEANKHLDGFFVDKNFGEAGSTIVIEEYLEGKEVSFFALSDGKNYVLMPDAKDYKRAGQGDTGPNTGGMGSVSPVFDYDDPFRQKVIDQVVEPTFKGIRNEGIEYKGFLYFGLINVNGDPHVIEYNVRMGDPEAQVVIPRIKSDFLALVADAAQGQLQPSPVDISEEYAVTVVLASEGYPGAYEKGKMISGLNDLTQDSIIFHAGTTIDGEQVITSGGRVLAITGLGKNMEIAARNSYDTVSRISWEGVYARSDIGYEFL